MFVRLHNHSCYGALSGRHLYVFADVVYIGVIHPYHLNTCLLFTNAKKNVLCEKPLAMNTKEVQQILASAKKNGVFLMEVQVQKTIKKKEILFLVLFFTFTISHKCFFISILVHVKVSNPHVNKRM